MLKRVTAFFLVIILSITLAGNIVSAAEKGNKPGAFASDEVVFTNDHYHYAYHLTDEGICGATEYTNDDILFEGLAGLRYKTKGTRVTFTAYSNVKAYNSGGDVYVQIGDKKITVGSVAANGRGNFDMATILKAYGDASVPNLYRIGIRLSDRNVTGYLYWVANTVYACRVGTDVGGKIKRWNSVVGDMNPQDYLEMWVGRKDNPITYPTSGDGYCNHVQLWRELSHKIIKDDTWSDELKVFALTQYLARNYAYDDYRVFTCDNVSRANKANAWNDDNMFMYYNKVGNCWDFANAMTIMCRENSIPCTSVDNDNHTANAVWLNGEWVCIDISVLVQHHCKEYDTNPAKWTEKRDGNYATKYGYYSSQFDTHNQGLCTPITSTSDNENPL